MTDGKKIDVRALAELARLDISDEETAKFETEIPEILKFVEVIQSVADDIIAHDAPLRNVMRKDEDPHEGGLYTEDLLAAAPARKGDRVAVKQVLHKKSS